MAFGHRAPKYRPQRDTLAVPCPTASLNRGRAVQPRRSCGLRRRRETSRCGRWARIGSRSPAPGHEQVITGFEEVEKAADALAGRLG